MHPVVSIATIFRGLGGLFLFVELCHADAHRSFQLQRLQTWKMRPYVSLVSAIWTCPSLWPLRTFWSINFLSSFMSKQIHWHWSLTNRKHGWGFCFALHCQIDVQQCILLFLCRQHGQNESCHLPSRPRLHPPTPLLAHTLCLHSSSDPGQAQSQRAQSYARLAAAGFHPLPSNLRWSTRLLKHNPCRVQIRTRKTIAFFEPQTEEGSRMMILKENRTPTVSQVWTCGKYEPKPQRWMLRPI